MKKGEIRIGILGCANIAKRSTIPAIKQLPDKFNLIGLASRNKSKADEFSSQFECEAIYSYQELIDRTDIDAIYIPLPTGLHKEWIIKALQAGKHVYAEKSIAISGRSVMNALTSSSPTSLAAETTAVSRMAG